MSASSARGGIRLLMFLVGVVVLLFYGLLAYGSYVALATLWRLRPDPTTAVLAVAVLTVVFGYLSLRVGTARLLVQLDARELPRERSPGVYEVLDGLVGRMDVETPRLMVVRLQTPNAFALDTAGRDTVVVDAALLRLLDHAEFEGLLAHELAHLERRDSLVQTLAFSAVQTVVSLAYTVVSPVVFLVSGLAFAAAWFRGDPASWAETVPGRVRQRLEQGVALAMAAVTLFARAHSRRREYAADARAAAVTGRPLALARALEKIERAATPEFGILSPLWIRGEVESGEEHALRDLFSTHPRTEDRVERLRRRAADDRVRVEIR
ncbi:zn-dependent protease with chaperone function [Halogeometricum pallidum JCM 14848]|uniref:Zn-dependent protease with chaperone function n=2 Tax=Halogeometricum TaxID=60846 RepID=M0DJR2_HALPD|nr:zn-dependent protease with chaperone function [Halogeometricum pallidum JCM 14848]